MTNAEAINWIINLSADIGKIEHQDLWHYEQALYEIRELLEDAQLERKTGRWVLMSDNSGYYHCCSWCGHEGFNGMKFCPNCGSCNGDET